MRKLLSLSVLGDYREPLGALLPDWEIAEAPSPEAAAESLEGVEILLGWHPSMDRAALDRAGDLRWIQLTHAGVDRLPLSLLAEFGLLLTTASGVHAYPIAETLFGVMLGYARNLFRLRDQQAKAKWERPETPFREIHGRTLGILGVGAIGREVARLGRAFGMRTLGLRRGGGATEHVDVTYGMEGLPELLSQCDYVVNVLPLTPETRGLMGAAAFAALRPGACYLCAGRGDTTDQEALLRALQTGRVAFAGLDVTSPEPLPPSSPLWRMENVWIGGHLSGGTDRYRERVMEIFFENIRAYTGTGRPARNLVDYEREY